MSMRERFSDEEWALVCHVPVDAFLLAATADQKVDEKEIAAFLDTISKAALISDPVHREVALTFATRGPDAITSELAFQAAESGAEMGVRIEATKACLKDKLTLAEYQSFLGSAVASGMEVAKASVKRRLFRKRETINDAEATALAAFAVSWGLEPSALQRYLG